MDRETANPHIVYKSINTTVALEYKVPMELIYDILDTKAKRKKKKTEESEGESDAREMDNLERILREMGISMEEYCRNPQFQGQMSISDKIKMLLSFLQKDLGSQELNAVLKGEKSIDSVLNPQAQSLWNLLFIQDNTGRYKPDKEMTERLVAASVEYALSTVTQRQERRLESAGERQERERDIEEEIRQQTYEQARDLERVDRIVTQEEQQTQVIEQNLHYDKTTVKAQAFDERQIPRSDREFNALEDEERENALRRYIAHMQGYDRDRDSDGGRGIDMKTGYVIDYGDIYLADHGTNVQELEDRHEERQEEYEERWRER